MQSYANCSTSVTATQRRPGRTYRLGRIFMQSPGLEIAYGSSRTSDCATKRMTDTEKVAEWTRFYLAAHPSYRVHALLAVIENDGEPVLRKVCEKLGLQNAVDLVKACR
jgi:hypothetical protein